MNNVQAGFENALHQHAKFLMNSLVELSKLCCSP